MNTYVIHLAFEIEAHTDQQADEYAAIAVREINKRLAMRETARYFRKLGNKDLKG